MEIIDVAKVLIPFSITFFIGLAVTPVLTHYLYKHKMWKKKSVPTTTDGRPAPISARLHNDEEVKVPRMGGIIIWTSVFITIFIFWVISTLSNADIVQKLNFLSRGQTWLPIFTLLIGAFIGFIDDYFSTTGRYDQLAGGLSAKKRLLVVTFVGLIGGLWFFTKLGIASIFVPFIGSVYIGILFVPFFILILLATYSTGVIDGLDGLSGGVFATVFSAYGIIAFFQNQLDIGALAFAVTGGILAFLWFNIPPARFYMSETGTMALTMTLGVIAFLTDQVVILPIIAFPLFATSLSSIIQLVSKRFRNGKKIFLVAPVHHHFEAIGWPSYKVVMRYWIISIVSAVAGILIVFVG